MTISDAEANRACDESIAKLSKSIWAAIRYYQMSVDAFLNAGQPPPPPRPELAGLVYVTPNGTVEPIDPHLDLTAPLNPANR